MIATLLPWVLGALAIFVLLPFAYGLIESQGLGNKYNYSSTYPKCFTAELADRFPYHKIFLIPASYSKLYKMRVAGVMYSDDVPEWWQTILEVYPKTPGDAVDVKAREELFWKRFAVFFSVDRDDGQKALLGEHDILLYFKNFERWIFREYFAATGKVLKTIEEEQVRLDVEVMFAAKKNPEKFEAKRDTRDHFERETKPAHMEKWGAWFYFYIQEAVEVLAAEAQTPIETGLGGGETIDPEGYNPSI